MRSHRASRRVFLHFFIGVLLVQLAWILALPTFRGIDEFDHVYKAAAVARGQWTSSGQAPDGRGGLVRIPGDIVSAASKVCTSYEYTKPDDCVPVRRFAGGDVEIATAASAYNPVYYLVVGTVARPFHGDQVDYVIRGLTAVICALLIACAAAMLAGWSTSRWPLALFTLGLTPVLVYSTAIASPNGIAYAGAVLLWTSLLAVVRRGEGTRQEAVGAGVGAVALLTMHGTGPMLAFLVFALVVALRPARAWWIVAREGWRLWLPVAVAVLLVAVACVVWIAYAHPAAIGEPADGPLTFGDVLNFEVLWLLEAIAVFPTVTEYPHPVVYALWGVPLLTMLVALLIHAQARTRAVAVTLFLLLLVLPVAFTVATYADTGLAWQGRYSLPLWVGVSGLASLVASYRRESNAALVSVMYVMSAAAVAMSTVTVGRREIAGHLPPAAAAHIPGGLFLVGALALAGVLLPLALPRRCLEQAVASGEPELALDAAAP